jgi:hypothetical protein
LIYWFKLAARTRPSGYSAVRSIRGNRNVLSWQNGEKEVALTRPLAVDNYEGITVADLGDGMARVWISSDDNFNPQQRTLLLAFDIAVASE